jgi:hypothetical protein
MASVNNDGCAPERNSVDVGKSLSDTKLPLLRLKAAVLRLLESSRKWADVLIAAESSKLAANITQGAAHCPGFSVIELMRLRKWFVVRRYNPGRPGT